MSNTNEILDIIDKTVKHPELSNKQKLFVLNTILKRNAVNINNISLLEQITVDTVAQQAINTLTA
jgi:hypothetical protein